MYWWQYLLLVNLYLVLFYGFYAILLRMETFFNLNRAYLVTSALLAFFIPLIHYEWVSSLFITRQVQQTISVYARPISIYQHHSLPIPQQQITLGNLIFLVYACGILFLVVRLIGQLVSLRRIIKQDESTSAFSFFKSIKLDPDLESRDIIEAHELVHARQWHSADVLLIEAIAIINWFNPIVYIYKKGIRHIHEFIADRQALHGTTKSEYALLLLSQAFETPANGLVNTFFNTTLLKRRILMLQKSRSTYMALLKYGLSAPLFMLMLVLSSAAVIKSHTVRFFNTKAEEMLSAPATHLANPKSSLQSIDKEVKFAVPEKSAVHAADQETRSRIAGTMHTEQLFVAVEREPQFKGGLLSFYQFLAANLQYPRQMIRYNIQGRVIINLTIEKDGSVSDVKAIRDLGYGSAEEAIRVLKKSPKWEPGYQNGQPVRVRYTLPISFDLVKEKGNDDTISKVSFNIERDSPLKLKKDEIAAADSLKRMVMVGGEQFDFMSNALYLLDGKSVKGMNSVDPDNIKSIRVIKHPDKDNVYVLLYGERALNGVVLIESKDAGSKSSK